MLQQTKYSPFQLLLRPNALWLVGWQVDHGPILNNNTLQCNALAIGKLWDFLFFWVAHFFDQTAHEKTFLKNGCDAHFAFSLWNPEQLSQIAMHWLRSHCHRPLVKHPQCDIMLKAGSKSCCGTAARWATSSTRSSTPCTSTAPPSSASTLGGMLFMIWKAATRMVCKRMEAVQDDWATRGNGAREGKSRKGSGHRPHIHTLTLPSPWLNLTWLYAFVEQCQEVTIPARSLSWPASRTNTTRCLQSIWKWTRTLSTDEVYCWKAILSSI